MLEIIYFTYLFAMGGIWASAVMCAGYRKARGVSWTVGRSKCGACGHTLGFVELLPVIGGLLYRGRCKVCGHKFGLRGSMCEFASGALCACIYFDMLFLLLWVLFILFCFVLEYKILAAKASPD